MASTTNIYGFPFPEDDDAPAGFSQIEDLAEAVETTIDGIDDRLDVAETNITSSQASITALQAKTTSKPLCILTKTAVQSIANAGAVLTFDGEVFDSHNMHSTSVNTSRITPTVAGYYRFEGIVHWSAVTGARRGLGIRINGGTIYYGGISTGTAVGAIGHPASLIIYMNGTTDYAEAYAFQDSGSATNTADQTSTRFSAEFIR